MRITAKQHQTTPHRTDGPLDRIYVFQSLAILGMCVHSFVWGGGGGRWVKYQIYAGTALLRKTEELGEEGQRRHFADILHTHTASTVS